MSRPIPGPSLFLVGIAIFQIISEIVGEIWFDLKFKIISVLMAVLTLDFILDWRILSTVTHNFGKIFAVGFILLMIYIVNDLRKIE